MIMETNKQNSLTGYSGTLEGLARAITSTLPKFWTYFSKTIAPILDGTLIQLFGAYSEFQKEQANSTIEFNAEGNVSSIIISLRLNIPALKGAQATLTDEQEDRQFIISKLGVLVPHVEISSAGVKFNYQTGDLVIVLKVVL